MSKLLTLCFLLLNVAHVQAASQVEQLFDSKDFVQNPKIAEKFWSRKENLLYGKSVILWNSQDFAALEKKLLEQREEERTTYINTLNSRGYVNLEDSLSYETHRANLDRALAALPDIRMWVNIARAESGEKIEERSGVEMPQTVPNAKPDPGNAFGEKAPNAPGDPGSSEEERLQKYFADKQAVYEKKKRILLYAVVGALSLIAVAWGYLWFRFYRPQISGCPKCGTRDKSMITASSPIKKGSGSILKLRVRRKYYCRICGYKWVKRTR